LLQSGEIGPKLAENGAAKAIPDATSPSMRLDPAALVAEPAKARRTQSGEGSHKMRETPDNDPDSS
jgi:hypothetical protein